MKLKIAVIYGSAAFVSTSFPNNAVKSTDAKHGALQFSRLAKLFQDFIAIWRLAIPKATLNN